MKTLIVLLYYERPNLVRNALESIKRQGNTDWELAVIDDGSPTPVEPIVKQVLVDYQDRIKIYRLNDTKEDKLARGGSLFGKSINEAVSQSNAEIVVTLCDDDALTDGYVTSLANFYQQHPSAHWGYCHVIPYDPSKGPPIFRKTNAKPPAIRVPLNRFTSPIAPSCQVDSSQVSFRRTSLEQVGFPYPLTASLDAVVFQGMTAKFGLCPFTGLTGQFKGVFADQLGNRKVDMYESRIK